MEDKLLNSIKQALNELIISFFNKEITDDVVLKNLNKAIHYNKSFSTYIYEMFYIQALELDKVPKNKYFLSGLFGIESDEDCLIIEKYDTEGTRTKVLKKLNLIKTLEMYKDFLIYIDQESHTYFRQGVNDPKYKNAKDKKISIEDVFNSLQEELKED
ncbi:MAG: hypothetical protein ACQESC_01535 [Nanobdellota archaeon]